MRLQRELVATPPRFAGYAQTEQRRANVERWVRTMPTTVCTAVLDIIVGFQESNDADYWPSRSRIVQVSACRVESAQVNEEGMSVDALCLEISAG